ncbi:MAG: 4Fe-4S dicluster domain-containing protein [Burkholderiales bacterium]|nr:4Fe-4S dicluster domain-containing protein [Burkholderiales bacterium]
MAKVYNWQIGREMEYPYEAARPKKQFGMVMDLNKCIACQTCTVACKTTWTAGRGQEYMYWNNVESKPYGFYPLGWDVRILERLGVQPMDGPVYRGKTLFDAAPEGERVLGYLPDDLDYAHPNIGEDDSAGDLAQGAFLQMPHMQWMYYLPRICNHCTYPGCLGACPRQSVYKRPEDGIVLIDQQRCRGYRECVRGCPYKKTYFNPMTRVSEKCIGCYPALENGRQSQCTITCIGKIRLQGFISVPDRLREDNPLDYIVHIARVARPLIRSSGWSRTCTTSRRCTCRPPISSRCSAGGWTGRSPTTAARARTSGCSGRCSCSAPRPRSSTTTGSKETTRSATTRTTPRSCACRSASRSFSARLMMSATGAGAPT